MKKRCYWMIFLSIVALFCSVNLPVFGTDTDNDGIDNSKDLDCDNDGILDVEEGRSTIIVNNPSFEDPSLNSMQILHEDSVPFWNTTAADKKIEIWAKNFQNVKSFDGEQHAEINANQFASLYQDIATQPHTKIKWSIAHRGRNGVDVASISIGPPGSLKVQKIMSTDNTAWVVYEGVYEVPVGQFSTRFSFDAISTSGGSGTIGNFIDKFELEVSDRDTDDDGISDYLDLDSDNDGISDLVESGANHTVLDSEGNGVIDNGIFTDSDQDGLADAVELINGNDKGQLPNNFDNDLLANFIDLDSDNDGIPDALEAQPTLDYHLFFHNDGDVRDDDLDKDGVIEMYDNILGHAASFNIPQNTDGVDLFDYLDLDSDNDLKSDEEEGGGLVNNVSYRDPNGNVNNPMLDLPNEFGDTSEVAYREVCNLSLETKSPFCEVDTTIKFSGLPNGGIWYGNGIDSSGNFNPKIAKFGEHFVYYKLGKGCVDSSLIRVNENPKLEIFTDTNNICLGSQVTFTYKSSIPLTECSLDFGDGEKDTSCKVVNHTYQNIGCFEYSIVGKSIQGCRGEGLSEDSVCVIPLPKADFKSSNTGITASYPEVDFTNLSENASTYLWDFEGIGTSSKVNPSFIFPSKGASYNVCLEAANPLGCKDKYCQPVVIKDHVFIGVPNAFTPDGDGLNDFFNAVLFGFGDNPAFLMQIWNRWGELVFETKNIKEPWNGKVGGNPPITNIYIWKIMALDLNGKKHNLMGHVSLLR